MIIMAAGRAQPVFPAGPFYTKDCSLFGFAMFNATLAEQRHAADDINRWLAAKKLHVPIGRTFPLSETQRPIGCWRRTRCTRRARWWERW